MIMLITSFVFISCEKEENEQSQSTSSSAKEVLDLPPGVTGAIYFATWSEWGRESSDCNGWGLCEYVDCWFCCYDENNIIVNCDTGEPVRKSGTIYVNEAGEYYMLIELNPSFELQEEAIDNEKIFYIDEDIHGDNFVLHQGDYIFDEEVGEYGGYTIEVSKK